MASLRNIVASVLLFISGCAVGPDYLEPEIEAGQGWATPLADGAPNADLETWWTTFNDPTLNRLIDTALVENFDIREANARVDEVRALRDAVAGGRWPAVEAGAGVTRRRQSENGPLPIDMIPGLERDQTIFEAGFDAAWELDVFGRNRRAFEAAMARAEAAADLRRGAELRVAAETGRTYFELRGAQHTQEAIQAAVESSRRSVELVRQQYAAGEVPEAAVAQAEAAFATTEAQLPQVEARVRIAALSIGILLGDLPEAEASLADSHSDFIELTPLPVGQRADLLRRRPDVRAAERMLAAATADVGVATAELFPKIGIGANGGFQSLAANDLLEAASETLTLGPLITWRVFDGGRVQAQIRASEARVEIAALEYEKAVKEALTDAELALTRYNLGLAALDRQQAVVAAAERSYRFANDRYRAGDISLLELLDAERGLRNTEDAYARTHTEAATNLVALYKALGGGWRADSESAAAGE
jgi:NodT family efflux transporter outer membrane factor (OMF) lipoprotein